MINVRLVSLILCCSWLLGGLMGCAQPSPMERMLDDYRQRVARVLELDAPPLAAPLQVLQPFPARALRVLTVTELRQGVFEVWDLKRCGLMRLISERNSSLGKVMRPSQQLLYEVRFWQIIDRCHHELQTAVDAEPELRAKIADIRRIKRDNLPKVFWNALFASEEFVRLFALGAHPYATDELPLITSSQRSLSYLYALRQQLFDSDLSLDSATLEQQYFQLQRDATGARLLKSMWLLSAYLNSTAELIEQRLAQRPLCLQGKPTPKARILQTVLLKFYAGQVQPYMALLQRHGGAWLQALNQLLDQQRALAPPAVMAYQQALLSQHNSDAPWQRLQRSFQRHTKAWQRILGQCGLMPGRENA